MIDNGRRKDKTYVRHCLGHRAKVRHCLRHSLGHRLSVTLLRAKGSVNKRAYR